MAAAGFNPSALVFTTNSPDQALETWAAATGENNRGMTLVTAGQSGTGKSTLVKNLLRLEEEEGVPTSKHTSSSVTEKIQVYEHEVDGVQVKIVDMPGLIAPDQNEKKLIAQLQKTTNGEADMLLYCVSIAPCSKLGYIDRNIVRLLTSTFKKQIWERTILVLTFADLAKDAIKSTKAKAAGSKNATEEDIKKAMEEIVNDYAKGFERILDTIVKPKKSEKLSVHPLDPQDIGNPRNRLQIAAIPTSGTQQEKILYDYSWDNYIYVEVLRKCNRDAIPTFLKISRHTPEDIATLTGGVAVAGGVGAGVGGAIGLGVGVGIGASVGGSLGLGIGAIPGAITGGILGVGASTVAGILMQRFKD